MGRFQELGAIDWQEFEKAVMGILSKSGDVNNFEVLAKRNIKVVMVNMK